MSRDHEKRRVAEAAIEYVRDGMTLGLGSGSTAEIAIELLGERYRDGLRISGVPTSKRSEELARLCGLPLVDLAANPQLDLTIDGADETDPAGNLIKGGGGALLREKIVAAASRELIVIVDSSKVVNTLGAFPLPVEVIPFAESLVIREIEKLGGKPTQRRQENIDGSLVTFVTDEGNHILDCDFGSITDPERLATSLSPIPGVVEHGLFIGMTTRVLIGEDETVRTL